MCCVALLINDGRLAWSRRAPSWRQQAAASRSLVDLLPLLQDLSRALLNTEFDKDWDSEKQEWKDGLCVLIDDCVATADEVRLVVPPFLSLSTCSPPHASPIVTPTTAAPVCYSES